MGPNLLEILLVFMNSVYLTIWQRDTAHLSPALPKARRTQSRFWKSATAWYVGLMTPQGKAAWGALEAQAARAAKSYGAVFSTALMTHKREGWVTVTCLSFVIFIYSQWSRCCTAKGSNTKLSLVGPTKVKAHKPFLFTKKFPCIKNKEHLLDFVITFVYYQRVDNEKIISQIVRISEVCDQNGDWVSKNDWRIRLKKGFS